jgi:uncharacterized protein (TIGR00106 family)
MGPSPGTPIANSLPEEHAMIVQFSIFPLDTPHMSDDVRQALEKLSDLGVEHQVNPMGTCIKGPWEKVMPAIYECHRAAMKEHERVITNIVIDDHGPQEHSLKGAVEAVVDEARPS